MRTWQLGLSCVRALLFGMIGILAIVLTARPAVAVELAQFASRENPAFDILRCRMMLGRDGKVYLAGGNYVLRLGRDGNDKLGLQSFEALTGAAANADGVLATSNAHFNHSVNLWNASADTVLAAPSRISG